VHTAAGIHWVQALADSLGMTWGCFHIEARFDGQRWDLIEVNPRIGGSLISHSVRAMTHTSLLGLWLDLLISARIGDPTAWRRYAAHLRGLAYDPQGLSPSQTGTFFRVYFAHSGVLETVELRPLAVAPVVAQILLHAGDVVAPQAREVFLGQVLWAFDRAEALVHIPRLRALSADAIDVRYLDTTATREPPAPAPPLTPTFTPSLPPVHDRLCAPHCLTGKNRHDINRARAFDH
jgi:biotin carboxylase